MDTIFLRDLRVKTIIGIFDWERRVRQTVSIDLKMSCDVAKAAASDDIADALDYKGVAKRIIEFVEGSEFQLVETLAERIAAIIIDEFGVERVVVNLNKPGAIRGAKDVGIRIKRRANA